MTKIMQLLHWGQECKNTMNRSLFLVLFFALSDADEYKDLISRKEKSLKLLTNRQYCDKIPALDVVRQYV